MPNDDEDEAFTVGDDGIVLDDRVLGLVARYDQIAAIDDAAARLAAARALVVEMNSGD